ncbi:MAG: formyltransferase family protein, partial [Vicinamibacteria bacterium]
MADKYFIQILGNRAESLLSHVRGLGCEAEMIESPDEISPRADMCLAAGVYYIVKPHYLRIPKKGIWGFHESALPEGRGSAPIHWTVLGGGARLTVSFFELAEKIDAGRILGEESRPIPRTALLEDLRAVAIDLSKSLLDRCLLPYLSAALEPYPQVGEASYFRRRTREDARL